MNQNLPSQDWPAVAERLAGWESDLRRLKGPWADLTVADARRLAGYIAAALARIAELEARVGELTGMRKSS